MLDSTVMNVGINTIMTALHSSVNTIQWVTTAYVLALGIMVLFTGWAADRFSGKSLYVAGLSVFLVGSIVSGVAGSVDVLLAGRIIQGAGAGLIIPLLSTLLVRATGGKNLGSTMAMVGLPVVFAPILGPTIGGFIIDQLNWHWIFYINIPIVIAALILIWVMMPTFPATQKTKRFDWFSFIDLGAMFSLLIVAIINFSEHTNITHASVIWPIVAAIVLLIAYVIYAWKRPKNALVSLSLFKSKNFSGSVVILLMSGITVNGALFLLPLYLQNVRGFSVVWSGIYLIAQGVGMLLTRTQVGKLTDQFGARRVVIISVAITIASTLPFVWFGASTSKYLVMAMLFFRGIGQGGLTIPVMSDSFVGLPSDMISQATTATRMIQNVGSALGTAVLATVISKQMTGVLPTVAHMSNAYHMAFIWSVAFTAVAIIPAWFLSHHAKVSATKDVKSQENTDDTHVIEKPKTV
ncbi:MFS transporter [Secundilactobacillus paracollinoides]|uniref:MFS transporter n=2 Tax=Secundilactobacillus paracollinoides TaxID=240427 RepID=A0A1B2J261_9LACO|nr:MFS transporter [Secundilactobacillus paracollinoides]ANZ68384.1 MFS transporter [Secundilactobacillus paracollinoides]